LCRRRVSVRRSAGELRESGVGLVLLEEAAQVTHDRTAVLLATVVTSFHGKGVREARGVAGLLEEGLKQFVKSIS
jgi:hypothetical protein